MNGQNKKKQTNTINHHKLHAKSVTCNMPFPGITGKCRGMKEGSNSKLNKP